MATLGQDLQTIKLALQRVQDISDANKALFDSYYNKFQTDPVSMIGQEMTDLGPVETTLWNIMGRVAGKLGAALDAAT